MTDLIPRDAAIEAISMSHSDFKKAIRAIPAIEPQPDPRDEVITRLVAALEMAKVWLDYNGAYDMQGINAALAAAKVVQNG